MAARVGVDVGGTFTDFFLLDEETGRSRILKIPSTPGDPSQALYNGLLRLLSDAGIAPDSLARLMHGTTVATNAVLEGRGARVGLLCTRGFEQVLHLARGETPGPLAGWITMVKPDPLAALEDTRGIVERVSARGEILEPLDLDHAAAALDELVERGVASIAVSLLHSYANPEHERRLADLVRQRHPGLPVSISSEVLPEFREYERTNVVVMNAYVRPVVESYLRRIEEGLQEVGASTSVSTNVTSSDFASYPILRFKDAPNVTSIVLQRPDVTPQPVGEPMALVAAAAVANALFDATGVRMRTAPLTPPRVRAALKAAGKA